MSLRNQTLWSLVPLLTITVVNLISVPLFYRFLGPEMYALWFYVITLTGTFGFMDLGLGVAVGRYLGVALGGNDRAALQEYWGTGNIIVLPLLVTMSLTFAAVGIFLGPRWFAVAPEHVTLLQWTFAAGGASLLFSYYGQFWLMLSQAHLEFRFLALTRLALSLLQVIPALFLARSTRNPFLLVAWSALIAFLQVLFFVSHARRHYHLGFAFRHARRVRAREMAGYTGKTFVSLLINSFLGSADRLVLGKLAPASDFSFYTISANVGGRIQALSVAVMGPVFSNSNRALGGSDQKSLAAIYNETFSFTFPWYLFAAVWVAVWHPIFLRIWLGTDLGSSVEPIFAPVIAGCCLTALSNTSSAQLGSLHRIGTGLFFQITAGILLTVGIVVGWHWVGMRGVAWGFVFSRIAFVAQDLYLCRLIGAGGWLTGSTWKQVAMQVGLGGAFSTAYFWLPAHSSWLLLPAFAHLALITSFLLGEPVRTLLAGNRPVAPLTPS